MSPTFPKLTGKQVISSLFKFGFEVTRIKGSHHILKHLDGIQTVVPVHGSETIGPGLLNKISKDIEMD